MHNEQFSLLGTRIQGLSLAEIVDILGESVQHSKRRIVLYHNLHSVYLYHHNKHVAALYDQADYVYVDGMALIFLGRLFGLPLKHSNRTTFLDCFEALVAEFARKNWRILYLGSKPGVAKRGAEILVKRFPNLQIFTLDGYFDARSDSPDNQATLKAINTFHPDVLLVGMGMPRQERWLLENLHALTQTAIVTAGATMDYLTGEIAQPPRWASPLGLYWLFRLFSDPRRLWRRYLLEPWYLLGFLFGQYFNKSCAFPQPPVSDPGND